MRIVEDSEILQSILQCLKREGRLLDKMGKLPTVQSIATFTSILGDAAIY